MKENELLIAILTSFSIIVYEMKTYQKVTYIYEGFSGSIRDIVKIDKERVVMLIERKSMVVFNITKGIVERWVNERVSPLIVLRDGNVFCKYNRRNFAVYDINENKVNKNEQFDKNLVYTAMKLNDESIVTVEGDNTIKIWKY